MIDRQLTEEWPQGILYKGKPIGSVSSNGYLTFRCKGKTYYNHMFVWESTNGTVPEGLVVDHIDGDRSNCRISNLRLATRSQNNMNAKSRSTTRGVDKHGDYYRVRIKANKVQYTSTGFLTESLAVEFADLLRQELHGEFYHESCPNP